GGGPGERGGSALGGSGAASDCGSSTLADRRTTCGAAGGGRWTPGTPAFAGRTWRGTAYASSWYEKGRACRWHDRRQRQVWQRLQGLSQLADDRGRQRDVRP